MPGRPTTSAGRVSIEAISRSARRTSGSRPAPAAISFVIAHPSSPGAYGTPHRSPSISASRWRSTASVARYHGSSSRPVASAQRRACSPDRSPEPVRMMSRSRTACSSPMAAPLPSDGFVHAHASPTGRTPVATGRPSTTGNRMRSSMPAITWTPVIGSASIQCAASGKQRTAADQRSGSRSTRSSRSRELTVTVSDHVPSSAGRVSSETESWCCWRGPCNGGIPPAPRKCRP